MNFVFIAEEYYYESKMTSIKMVFYRNILILSALLFSFASTEDSFSGALEFIANYAYDPIQIRTKREIPEPPLPGAQCFGNCMKHFSFYIRNRTNGAFELRSLQQGFFKPADLFDDDTLLPDFCRQYNITTECTNQCADFRGNQQARQSLRSLQFLCLEHYQEFITYQPCYRNVSTKTDADKKCKMKCGGENYVLEQVTKLDMNDASAANGSPDFGALMQIMGNLCGFIQCHLTCQQPFYTRVCATTAPADLLQEFISQTIGMAMDQLKLLGLHSLIPHTCTELAGGPLTANATVEAPAKVEKSENLVATTANSTSDGDLLRDKLTLELAVLQKESIKLDLEMQKLTLEKRLYERQLNGDFQPREQLTIKN